MQSTGIFQWFGITRNQSYESAGAIYAENMRFYIDGELQRRRGMAYQATQSGSAVQNFLHPQSGYWSVWVSSTGTIAAVSL